MGEHLPKDIPPGIEFDIAGAISVPTPLEISQSQR
jgi:hypothetical protein